MKKFILWVLLPVVYFLYALFPLPPASIATAETERYACILSENCYFYASQDETRGLFLLPKSYFVKVLSLDGEYTQIEYLTDGDATKRIRGFAKTDQLTLVDFTPNTPYLYHTFDVRYVADGGGVVDSSLLGSITFRCVYYGDYVVGTSTYCYVLRDGIFTYVPKPVSFSYPENTEYADYLATHSPSNSQTDNTDESIPPAQIAILILLCLLVPTLAAIILKPPKRLPYESDDFS